MNKKSWPGQLHHYYFHNYYLWIMSILPGISQIAFNISNIIKTSSKKEIPGKICSFINQA